MACSGVSGQGSKRRPAAQHAGCSSDGGNKKNALAMQSNLLMVLMMLQDEDNEEHYERENRGTTSVFSVMKMSAVCSRKGFRST